jgi:hypothetical protein
MIMKKEAFFKLNSAFFTQYQTPGREAMAFTIA